MKKFVSFSILLLVSACILDAQKITLPECVGASLRNKDNIIALRTDVLIASLQKSALKSAWLPQISASYDYRYYALRPSTIIPIGLFSDIPTGETRAMKFGTPYQSNAGISVYQPLVDLSIRSRLNESSINEKLKNSDLRIAETDLKAEVIKTYMNVWVLQEQVQSAALDTLRSGGTMMLLQKRLSEGQAQQIDVNNAIINRNTALSAFNEAFSSMIREKIYLAFLTGLETDYLFNAEFDFSIDAGEVSADIVSQDSLPEVYNLRLRNDMLKKQIVSEKRKFWPVVGAEGFIGANQYTNDFEPFTDLNWFGTSYLGLTVKLPVLTGENRISRIKQLRLQSESLGSAISDRMKLLESRNLQLLEEIRMLGDRMKIIQENIGLLTQNTEIFSARLSEGQVNATELLNQQTELRKETSSLNETRARLTYAKLELLTGTGRIESFLDSLE